MKNISLLFIACILLSACQKKVEEQQPDPLIGEPMTRDQINLVIKEKLISTGSFDWKDASDLLLWSALQKSDKVLSVGYQAANEPALENRLHLLDLNEAKWTSAKQSLIDLVYNAEHEQGNLQRDKMEVYPETNLPVINVKVNSVRTIRMLRSNPLVRYVEPMGYDPISDFEKLPEVARSTSSGLLSGSGCGGYDGNNSLVPETDYSTIFPNAKVSWNYNYHNIPAAWLKSSGAGVKIMIIDTGVSPDQQNLGSEFNQGTSTGRTIEKLVTVPYQTSTADLCGHGTVMSGTAAAPRCTDGNSCGVAYNASLIVCRATNDVMIDGSDEVKGVSDAYVLGANNPSVKIISMSLGRLTSSSQIKDAIQYAYGKGKLMFCAGGTSTSITAWLTGVIFPASMPEVQAITGIKDKTTMTACTECHKGSQIDFVVVMEKQINGLHGLATAVTGDVPTTVGGSSVATATASGIAALVWSRYPNYTREQVINKLVVTSGNYPNKSSSYGWGKLNADAATN